MGTGCGEECSICTLYIRAMVPSPRIVPPWVDTRRCVPQEATGEGLPIWYLDAITGLLERRRGRVWNALAHVGEY